MWIIERSLKGPRFWQKDTYERQQASRSWQNLRISEGFPRLCATGDCVLLGNSRKFHFLPGNQYCTFNIGNARNVRKSCPWGGSFPEIEPLGFLQQHNTARLTRLPIPFEALERCIFKTPESEPIKVFLYA